MKPQNVRSPLLAPRESREISFQFEIGDRVTCPYKTEEGQSYTDEGYIVGQSLTLPEALIPGNWYLIEWTAMPNCGWLPCGHLGWEHESHLYP